MKILVCGLHRSGTSAAAHLLGLASEFKVIDDPEFAVFERDGPLKLRDPSDWLCDDNSNLIVKMPRAAEYLDHLDASGWKIVFVARKPTAVFRSILEAQFGQNSSVRSMLCYQRVPTKDRYLNGFVDAYLYYYSQILTDFNPKFRQVCDYDQLVSTLSTAARTFGIETCRDRFEKSFIEMKLGRVDPPHNKPDKRDFISSKADMSQHLPVHVQEEIEDRCGYVFEEVLKLTKTNSVI